MTQAMTRAAELAQYIEARGILSAIGHFIGAVLLVVLLIGVLIGFFLGRLFRR